MCTTGITRISGTSAPSHSGSRSENVTISNHYNCRSRGLGLPGNEESTKVSRIGEMSTDLSTFLARSSRNLAQTLHTDLW